MNIKEIANKINELALKGEYSFSKIQKIRQKNNQTRPRTWKPFANFSIKDKYAFHAGGRKELQFNFGEDKLNGNIVFRYGYAFSLEMDKTVHNPKADFKDLVSRFNDFLISNPIFFKGFSLWYYENKSFGKYFDSVKVIDDTIFKAGNFIFIGKYFEKEVSDISVNDIYTILETFDYLLLSYETIQFDSISIEKRIARLAFSTNGWVMPSGPYGKSKHKDSHEAKYNYGHEEWLFDTSKLIDGYHYGFLEPIRKQQDAYKGHLFNVWLYTIDGISKKRFWVGEINNLEVLDQKDADAIKILYKKKVG